MGDNRIEDDEWDWDVYQFVEIREITVKEFYESIKARLLKETRVDHGMLVDTSSEDNQ